MPVAGSHRLLWSVALCLVTCAAHAEVYRWVDEQGKTHYSDKKPDGVKAPVEALKTEPTKPPAKRPDMEPNYWQQQEFDFKTRQAKREEERLKEEAKKVAAKPKSRSKGIVGDTDESRCNFAKDIIDESIVHRDGKPADANEKKIAQRDVEKYCKN